MIDRQYAFNGNKHTISTDPAKIIFWVGAGVGIEGPCCLPSGNRLTDQFLENAIGGENKKRLLKIWQSKVLPIQNSMINGKPHIFNRKKQKCYDSDYPRLEYVVGEVFKQDQEYDSISELQGKRNSCLQALHFFGDAPPNINHEWLASFALAGSVIVTTNYDICIEKAMGLNDVKSSNLHELHGVKDVVEYRKARIYHIHGIVTKDPVVDKSLGVTLRSVTRRLSQPFHDEMIRLFRDGYSIVFVGYGGVDFFDVKPFFDELDSLPGQAVYYCFAREGDTGPEKSEKQEYLLRPFTTQTIVYGDSAGEFLKTLALNSGLSPIGSLYTGSETMNEDIIRGQMQQMVPADEQDEKDYYFMNLFRLTCQMQISMNWFYKPEELTNKLLDLYSNWDRQDLVTKMLSSETVPYETFLETMASDKWKNSELQVLSRKIKSLKPDRNESNNMSVDKQIEVVKEALITNSEDFRQMEINLVHRLCGPEDHAALIAWGSSIGKKHREMTEWLSEHRERIRKISGLPYNVYRYRTFYLSLKRHEHLLDVILDGMENKDIQLEWDIAAEVPDLYDAELQLKCLVFEQIARLRNGKWPHPLDCFRYCVLKRRIRKVATRRRTIGAM